MSLIKKQITQIRISFPQIIKAFLLFILSSSGLAFAIFLRFLDSNGTVIAFGGILVEIVALTINYFLFRKYLRERKAATEEKEKKSKFYE